MAQKNVINLKGDKLHSNLTNGAALKRGDHAGFFLPLFQGIKYMEVMESKYSERKIMCKEYKHRKEWYLLTG